MSEPDAAGADLDRRFGGIARLYGDDARARLAGAHVCVVGIGGVGSWSAEALARSAIGALTLIDLDMIAESNVNRQIHALGDAFGRAKVGEMANRIRAINPACQVTEIEDFVTPDNVGQMLAGRFDAVIDAVDETRAKVALILHCCAHDIPIVTAGAAGGRIDPTSVVVSDLAQTTRDALLSRVRKQLRQAHGFPRDPKRKFGVAAVHSSEQLRAGVACDATDGGLSCTGYGSSVCVTAAFGFAAAAVVLRSLAQL